MDGAYPYWGLAAAALGVYTLAMLGIGAWAGRQVKDAEDYIVAGRKLGFPLLFGTVLATWICGGLFMGGMAESYKHGFQGAILDPVGPGLWLLVAPVFYCILMRRARYMTVPDMISTRYSKHAGLICSLAIVVYELFWVCATVTAFGSILSTFLNWPLWVGILAGGLILIVYTWQGGMWAVTVTDLVQMVLLCIGMIMMLGRVVDLAGGWHALIANAATKENALPFNVLPGSGGFYGWTGMWAWSYLISGVVAGLGANAAAQDYWERALSGRSIKTIIWASATAGLVYLALGSIPYFIGIGAYKIAPSLSAEQVESLGPWLLVNYFSPAAATFIAVAMAAAVMSSADSGLLALASVCGKNLLQLLNPKAGDGDVLKWTRRWVTIGGIISLVMALFFQEIFRVQIFGHAILAIAAFPMMTLGLFDRKSNNLGALTGTYLGMGVWIGFSLFLTHVQGAGFWDASEIAMLPALIVSFATMFVVSRLTAAADPPKCLVDVDGNPLPTSGAVLSCKALFRRGEIE